MSAKWLNFYRLFIILQNNRNMKNRDFLVLFPLLQQLKDQKQVRVKTSCIEVFKSFCDMTGLKAQVKPCAEDTSLQLVYID